MLPNFIIIGAQKSGTTWIHKCLEEHPEVFMPSDETLFFEDPYYFQSDINQFEKLFNNIFQKKAIGIKRPSYLAKPECPERIYRHIPNAKLIATLRNPVERAISAYFHYMRYGLIPIKPVEEGLIKIINGEYEDSHPISKEIIDFGFYYRHLMHYLNYFDRNQIFIILYEDIEMNPLKSIKRIYEFLGINDEYIPKALESRSRPGMYSLARLRLITIRNKIKLYVQRTFLDKLINKMTIFDHLLLSRICNNYKPELSADLSNKLFKYMNKISIG